MKIGSGIYKNRSVKVVSDISRPTTVRTRKVIFDILQYMVPSDFRFLDVFAGSGIMGMEALSRGASNVIFFDIEPKCIKLIEKNLKGMEKITGSYSVHKCNALTPPKGSPIDVIFLDPPYDKPQLIHGALKKLYKYGWIDEETIIIVEKNEKTTIKPFSNMKLKLLKDRVISRTLIQFFQLDLED